MTQEFSDDKEVVHKMNGLQGYINIKILTISHVFISNIHGGPNFTMQTLAKEIKDAIEYLLSRPDVYTHLDHTNINNMILKDITFDTIRSLYVANIRAV
jgi:predicted ATP-grasp superfamily ATP-dependent carboligase